MTIKDLKCRKCALPTRLRYYYSDKRRIQAQYRLSKEAMLKGWAEFLDVLWKLPEDRRLPYISKAANDCIIVSEMNKFFSDDDLAQLTKFGVKMDVFKTDLEEWM